MNTIICIVVGIIIIVSFILFIKYFTGKDKPIQEKTSIEKISHTISSSIENVLSNAAKGMRSFDTIKNEIIKKINNAKATLKKDYSTYLTNMITARETYLKVISNIDEKIPEIKDNAKKLKEKYNTTQNPMDKEYANRYISRMISMQKNKQNAQEKYDSIVLSIENAKYLYDLETMKLEDKYLEIITLTCSPDVSAAISSFNIDDLTSEFKSKLEEKKILNEVKSIVNEEVSFVNENINTSEIESIYNTL